MAQILAVSCRDVFDDPRCAALFEEYAAECSLPELAPINPQRMTYEAMEKAGALQVFGVYDEGLLIGFAWLLTWVVPHYGKRILSTESLFIAAAHRSYGLGYALMKRIEGFAQEKACCAVQYTAPVDSRFARYLGLRKDCRLSNLVFVRSLK